MFIRVSAILLILNVLETITVDLPEPRLVIIGQTGAGNQENKKFMFREGFKKKKKYFPILFRPHPPTPYIGKENKKKINGK